MLPQVLLSIRQAGVFYSPTAQIALRHDPAYAGSDHDSAGQALLTPRQLQAIALCAAYPRDSLRELAARMGVTASTVRNLLSQSYGRLQVSSRAQAVLRAEMLGLLIAHT